MVLNPRTPGSQPEPKSLTSHFNNKPQHFSGLFQCKYISHSCKNHSRCSWSVSGILTTIVQGPRFLVLNGFLCCICLDGRQNRELLKVLANKITHITSCYILYLITGHMTMHVGQRDQKMQSLSGQPCFNCHTMLWKNSTIFVDSKHSVSLILNLLYYTKINSR